MEAISKENVDFDIIIRAIKQYMRNNGEQFALSQGVHLNTGNEEA